MSIIPGIETAAPDRTDSKSGAVGSPNRRPVASSTPRSASRVWVHRPSGKTASWRWYATHASVVIVSPGGTGSPAAVMAARPAPFPPSSALASPTPSGVSPTGALSNG